MVHDDHADLNGQTPQSESLTPEQELASLNREAMLQEWASTAFHESDIVEVRFVHKDKPYPKGCHPTSVYRRAADLHSLVEQIEAKEEAGFHIFFGMHPRKEDLGTK